MSIEPVVLQNIFIKKWKPWLLLFLFLAIVVVIFAVNAFPSLYGDEYGSLNEANHVGINLHSIGYDFQLNLWQRISGQDAFLRDLSIIWLALGVYWLYSWLKSEGLNSELVFGVVLLAILNPFLWVYGFQIRFYAYFFASSILFIWRFRLVQQKFTAGNLFLLVISVLLILTSHLFSVLVVFTVLTNFVWGRLKNRWYLFGGLFIVLLIIIFSPIRLILIDFVYRMTANIPPAGDVASRGISLAMFAKIPLAFYSFIFGERVYPLLWWVTAPGGLVVAISFMLGIWNLRRLSNELANLAVFMLLNVPLLFLVLDPLAPPGLQGAAPRYMIFVVPCLLLIVTFGSQFWKPLYPALVILSLICLYFLAEPTWSYDSSNLVNWPQILKDAVPQPAQTCVVTDGRAQAAVARYIPSGTKVAYMGKVADCSGYPRIILVSDDFRLSMVRYFDQMSNQLSSGYRVVANTALFPAQVSVYQQTTTPAFQVIPSRLDLPEQDLYFPINLPAKDWRIQGFARLDKQTPSIIFNSLPASLDNSWILSNYRTQDHPPTGASVFLLHFHALPGYRDVDLTLRSGMETAAWDGECRSCESIYRWTKLVSLVGSYAYPGAYQQYESHIWSSPLRNIAIQGKFDSLTITLLLPDATGYFYGLLPKNQ